MMYSAITTDRVGALYTCKDKAVFTVTITSDGKPVEAGICTVKLTLDGGTLIAEKKHELAGGNPFKIEAALDYPGFIRCEVISVDNFQLQGRAAAGFNVEKIRQGYPEPPDFEQYWSNLLKRQAAMKNSVSCEALPDNVGKPGYKYYKITVKTVDDGKIYGFLGIPANNPGPFAALVMIEGAGPGYIAPEQNFIRPDMMTLAINVHPIDPTLPQAEYQKRYKEMIAEKPYWLLGAPDRDKYYFRNAIIGINAAIDYLANHPQFNKKDLFYLGTSQGGGFGLILGGLNQKFTAIAAGVPGLCDFGGIAAGRNSGGLQIVKEFAGRDKKLMKQCLEMSGYFDAVNFAKRVKCPIIFTVGFNDMSCCPSSVYAAYNAVKSTKYIMTGPLEGHALPWERTNGIWQWLQNGLDENARNYRAYYFNC